MGSSEFDQGKSNTMPTSSSSKPGASSWVNVKQTSANTPGFNFGKKPSTTTAIPIATEHSSQSTSTAFGKFGVPCNNAAAPPSLSEAESTVNNLPELQFGRFACIVCKKHTDPRFGFCCWSCCNFYHNQCPTTSVSFGTIRPNHHDEFGLPVCNNCHSQLRNAKPAPFLIKGSLQFSWPEKSGDTRPIPRRSSRDPTEASWCKSPDPVAILAEHFASMNENPFNKPAPETLLTDQDDQFLEPRYEFNDRVKLIELPQEHPDRHLPFTIIARHHVEKNFVPEDNAHEHTHVNDGDRMVDVGERILQNNEMAEAIVEEEEEGIGRLFGQGGWYYKLDRCPNLDIVSMPGLALWHEDDLELALEDHDSDNEGEDEECYVELPMKEERENREEDKGDLGSV